MGEWQPIETAPKDGTEVDVWVADGTGGGYRIADAYWCASRERWRFNGQIHDIAWTDDPTHWMPLPSPPLSLTGA